MTATPILVAVGGALGAVGRFAVGEFLDEYPLTESLPSSTLAVNALGTLVIAGVALGLAWLLVG